MSTPVKSQMTRAVATTAKPEDSNTVGRTYGERAQRPQTPAASSQNAQSSRFSGKNKQEAVENFGANDRFQKSSVRPTGAGNTPYKSQGVDIVENGLSQALNGSSYRPDDDVLSQFLDQVISNPVLGSTRALRQHLTARPAAAPSTLKK